MFFFPIQDVVLISLAIGAVFSLVFHIGVNETKETEAYESSNNRSDSHRVMKATDWLKEKQFYLVRSFEFKSNVLFFFVWRKPIHHRHIIWNFFSEKWMDSGWPVWNREIAGYNTRNRRAVTFCSRLASYTCPPDCLSTCRKSISLCGFKTASPWEQQVWQQRRWHSSSPAFWPRLLLDQWPYLSVARSDLCPGPYLPVLFTYKGKHYPLISACRP